MDFPLYNQKAEKAGKVSLPDSVFGVSMNSDLLYQVVNSQMANKRQTVAHSKDRGEVRGGGKKPWRQKGTGRARHGSTRSPIWKGGGATFGPRKERNFKKDINKKMARKALFVALSAKVKDNELVVIDDLKMENWKTKEMSMTIKNISQLFTSKEGSLLIIEPLKMKDTIERTVRNLPRVDIIEAKNLNALEVMARKNLVLFKDAIEALSNNFVK